MRRTRVATVAIFVVALFALMAPAFAAEGSGEKPPPVTGPKIEERHPTGPDPTPLPFTGSDVTGFVAVGALAVVAGGAIVRRTRTAGADA
ncbi:MAG: hypothetical protein ABR529_14620 [Actinomycetota bacterium]